MIDLAYKLMLSEVVFGGGGRVFPIGPLTLRMVLFVFCLVLWILTALQRKRSDGLSLSLFIIFVFLLAHIPAAYLDAASGVTNSQIIEVALPVLFWLNIPFVAFALNKTIVVEQTARIILYGGLVLSIFLLLLYLGLFLGYIGFVEFYLMAASSQELAFRSEHFFFFKGHFFVCIAFIFCIILRPKYWKLMSVVFLLAIAGSLTRGLWLITVLSIVFIAFASRRYISAAFLLLFITVLVLFFVAIEFNFLFGSEARRSSIDIRLSDTFAFLGGLDLWSLFFGVGFGADLNNRPNVENSYLWAVWRFGIFGLIFWLLPFLMCAHFYRRISPKDRVWPHAASFFYGMVALQILSLTNPFINNSIGILYASVSIFSLRRLARDKGGSFRLQTH